MLVVSPVNATDPMFESNVEEGPAEVQYCYILANGLVIISKNGKK